MNSKNNKQKNKKIIKKCKYIHPTIYSIRRCPLFFILTYTYFTYLPKLKTGRLWSGRRDCLVELQVPRACGRFVHIQAKRGSKMYHRHHTNP